MSGDAPGGDSNSTKPRVTMGFPWVEKPPRRGESGVRYECRVRLPGFKYDEEEGWHALVAVERPETKWRTYIGSSGGDAYETLDDAIEAAEAALVDQLDRILQRAERKLYEAKELFKVLGVEVPRS